MNQNNAAQNFLRRQTNGNSSKTNLKKSQNLIGGLRRLAPQFSY